MHGRAIYFPVLDGLFMRDKHPRLFPRFLRHLEKIDPVLFGILDEHDSVYDYITEICDGCLFFEGCNVFGEKGGRFCKTLIEHAWNNLPAIPVDHMPFFLK